MIKKLGLTLNDYHFDGDKESLYVDNLSKVNIFVGQNNSGKSRLLRRILETELKYDLYGFPSDKVKELVIKYEYRSQEAKRLFSNVFEVITVGFNKGRKYIFKNKRNFHSEAKGQIDSICNYINQYFDNTINKLRNDSKISGRNPRNEKTIENLLKDKKEIENFKINSEFTKIYIPILRGLRPISESHESPDGFSYDTDVYESRTQKDYFGTKEYPEKLPPGQPGKKTGEHIVNYKIFTGHNLYEEIKKKLLGKRKDRDLIRDYENYLKDNFFDGKEISITPNLEDNVLNIEIGDQEYPIYNLGDGLQSIIINTFPMFINRGKDMLFFVEEPEHLIHPGLQRKLLETYLKEEDGFENFQFFFTTHSNHFLDMTMDEENISIYSLEKDMKKTKGNDNESIFNLNNLSNKDSKALDLLGVRNSSVFLSNCTIWVEGVTDRKYFRKYLEVYMNDPEKEKGKKYQEDLHYSFVEYAGSNLGHWNFDKNEDSGKDENQDVKKIDVKRLCGKAFLIADKDTGKEEKHQGYRDILGDNYQVLPCIEVENLLTPNVLKEIIKEKEGEELEEKLKSIKQEDYKNESLGSFLDDKLKIKKYAAESGTLKSNYKMDFSNRALKHIKDIKDISEDAKKEVEKIYKHIEKHNV